MSVLLCGWDDGNPYSEPSAILRRFAGWAASMIPRVGRPERFGPCTCIAVCRVRSIDPDPLAVAIYHNHEPDCRVIEMSMAAGTPHWATRGTIRALLSYPFQQLRCGVVVCRVPRRSRRTKRFLSGIGFRNTGTIPDGYGDDDCSIYSMRRADAARWLLPAQQKEAA